jgi:transcription initiation factor TFIIIB Brf1 subunit/transcription initiation factor TFIIB
MSQIESRYEIICQTCGYLTFSSKKQAALDVAKYAETNNHKECHGLFVFDRFAHDGAPDTFFPSGAVRTRFYR